MEWLPMEASGGNDYDAKIHKRRSVENGSILINGRLRRQPLPPPLRFCRVRKKD
jgi:hypothetical protein